VYIMKIIFSVLFIVIANFVKSQNCIQNKDSIGYTRISSSSTSSLQQTFTLGQYEKCRYVKIRIRAEVLIRDDDGATIELQLVDSAGIFDQQSKRGRTNETVIMTSELLVLMDAFKERRVTVKSFSNKPRSIIQQLKVELLY
jgi:hypothetical protein